MFSLFIITGSFLGAFASGSSPLDTSTSTLITVLTNETPQQYPAIFEDLVIWVDSPGKGNIHLYNISTGEELSFFSAHLPAEGELPDIFDHFIAWTSATDTGYGIILYDILSGEEMWIADGNGSIAWSPDIDAEGMVWEEYSTDGWDIMFWDIGTGATTILTPNTTEIDQNNPTLSGDWVAWQGLDPASGTYDISLVSLTMGNGTLVTPGTGDSDEINPAIDGDYLVYQRLDPDTYCYDIYLYVISSGETVLLTPGTGSTNEESPSVHEGKVIWIGQDPGDFSYDLYLYEICTGSTWRLERNENRTDPGLPAIFGNRIVWQQPDPVTWYSDIYMLTLGIDQPPLAAAFSVDTSSGGVPLQVNFTNLSSGEPSGWHWDFGDGNTSVEQNPSHIYSMPGIYDVSLVVHTPYQRSGATTPACIYAGSPPTPAFSFDRGEGLAPLTVNFSDHSTGSPETYLWDFGDGSLSDEKDPSHTYLIPGTYRVSLTTGNEFGNSTSLVDGCIVVPRGVRNEMQLDLPGISCQYTLADPELTLNSSLSRVNVVNDTAVEVIPDQGCGIEKVLFALTEGFSWIDQFSLKGNLTGATISSTPLFYGDDNSTLSYVVNIKDYPANGTFRAEVWKNATPLDYERFTAMAILANYSGICGVAFTARFEQCNVPSCPNGTLTFGLEHGWIEQNGWRRPVPVNSDPEGAQVYFDGMFMGVTPLDLPDNLPAGNHTLTIVHPGYQDEVRNIILEEKRESIRVIRIAEDGSFEIIPVTFLFHDDSCNLDYFSAESPHGFSTFGAVSTSHAGSPIQIFYLVLSKIFSGGGGSGGATGGGGGGYGGSGSLGSAAPAATVIPTVGGSNEEMAPLPTDRSAAVINEDTSPSPSVPATHQDENPLPGNPEAVFPSLIGYSLVRNVAIVFGVILVATLFVLRWKRGGNEP